MPLRSLADWLSFQEQLHPNTIDLGLERLTRVLARLQWRRPACPVITVGGTNGKGSCVALLDSIYFAAGYRVGTFTSPHLIRYNERIRVAGQLASDSALVAVFERIEAARAEVSLTFFEFNALAALLIFAAEKPDIIVLEVGLGGRLDAVNVVDADVAIVSSIALDHCEWLGDNVESIGREKAGIFRPNAPAIFGARARPKTIAAEAVRIGAQLRALGVDFDFSITNTEWSWRGGAHSLKNLPPPALTGAVQFENAAAVLAAVDALQSRLPVQREAIERGFRNVVLPGRFQVLQRRLEWILDVAHNPAAAVTLAENLAARLCVGRTLAICGMFKDKDAAGVIAAVEAQIDLWIIADVVGGRALPSARLASIVEQRGGQVAHVDVDVDTACEYAESIAQVDDRIVVFGSFYTVGPALEWLDRLKANR